MYVSAPSFLHTVDSSITKKCTDQDSQYLCSESLNSDEGSQGVPEEKQQSVSVSSVVQAQSLNALEDSSKLVVGARIDLLSSPTPMVILSGQRYTHKITTGLNVSRSSHPAPSSVPRSSSPLPPTLVYSKSDPDYQAVKSAAECLHAHDYPKMASILERAPTTVPVLFGRGLAYYKLAKYFYATNAFEDMLHESEGDPDLIGNVYLAHYYIGEIDLGHSRYEQAARHFEQSAAAFCTQTLAKRYRIVPPSQAILYSKRGSALNHSKRVMDAVESYKKAISVALTPEDKLAARTSLGNLYQSLGDKKNALEQYEETVKLAEQLEDFVYLSWAHGNMGNAYLGLLQKDKALHHLEKSLDLSLRYKLPLQAVGRAYNNLGKLCYFQASQ